MPFLEYMPLQFPSGISDEKGLRYRHPLSNKPATNHYGIDLLPGNDQVVYAAHSGVIVWVSYNEVIVNGKVTGFGNYLRIESSGAETPKKTTLYAHLKNFAVIPDADGNMVQLKIGDGAKHYPVGAGTPIGIVGATGGASGVHLHFELWVGAFRENPRPYLAEVAPYTFPREVKAGKLVGDILGDFRNNDMYAGSYNNTLIGLEGEDRYYVYLRPEVTYQIVDIDNDGIIS